MIINFWFYTSSSMKNGQIKRDGIPVFCYSLIYALALNKHISQIKFWCHRSHLSEIKKYIYDIFRENNSCDKFNKISFISSWSEESLLTKINNNLGDEVFFHFNCIHIKKHLKIKNMIAILYDIYPISQLSNLFIITSPNLVAKLHDSCDNINYYSDKNLIILCNSQKARLDLLKYTKIKEQNAVTINIPCILPKANKYSADILLHHNLEPYSYLIYPTQIRAQKNVEVIIKALHELNKQNIKITLLLTGRLSDYYPAELLAIGLRPDNIKQIKSVSSSDLNSLYHYSLAALSPSLEEGSCPSPVREGLINSTPVISSNITQVREYLTFRDIDINDSGLLLFEPHDYLKLTEHIKLVQKNRSEILLKQQKIKDKFLSYNWPDYTENLVNLLYERFYNHKNENN